MKKEQNNYNSMKWPWPQEKSTPHICPVCGGKGFVPNGFYDQTLGIGATTDATPEVCRTCGGDGIVWSK